MTSNLRALLLAISNTVWITALIFAVMRLLPAPLLSCWASRMLQVHEKSVRLLAELGLDKPWTVHKGLGTSLRQHGRVFLSRRQRVTVNPRARMVSVEIGVLHVAFSWLIGSRSGQRPTPNPCWTGG